jgi:ankyrin repeat protein
MCTKTGRILRAITAMLAVGLAYVLINFSGIANANDMSRDLILASMKGDVEKVKSLLDSGADVNAKDQRGWSALLWAMRAGHQNVVKVLLDRGAENNPEILIPFDEQLMEAVDRGDPIPVKTLLDKGTGGDLGTFLARAAARDKPEIVQILLEKGADANVKDMCGFTLLMRAAEMGHPEIVKVLLDKGAQVNIKNLYGQTALMWAASKGKPEAVKALLDAGADLNARDPDGETPLMWAAHREGGAAKAKLLIDKGADVNAKDKFGWTALTHGACHGHSDIVKLLKDQVATVTLMDMACLGDLGRIECFIKQGADVNEKSGSNNITPLRGAAELGHVYAAKLLLDKGADIDARDKEGRTVLMVAAEFGLLEVTRFLLDNGADVNAEAEGLPALSRAAREGHLEIVKLLLEKGADVRAEPSPGWTALQMAHEGGHEEIAELLKAHGAKE